jgi:hypothetical protein
MFHGVLNSDHCTGWPRITLCADWPLPRIFCGARVAMARKICAPLDKLCRVTSGEPWQNDCVENILVHRLDGLRPAIKARWTALLCAEPATPRARAALITPEMLVFMLDDTLARLSVSLGGSKTATKRMRILAPFGAMRSGCHCGLNLLLTYYLAGARALRETLPMDFGPARVEVIRRFNRLAHDEMTALCGVCRHRGGGLCSLRPKKTAGAVFDSGV